MPLDYNTPTTSTANFMIYQNAVPVFATNDLSSFLTQIKSSQYNNTAVAFVYANVSIAFDATETVKTYHFYETATISGDLSDSQKTLYFNYNGSLSCNGFTLRGFYYFYRNASISVLNAPAGLAMNACRIKGFSNLDINLDATCSTVNGLSCFNLGNISANTFNIASNIAFTNGISFTNTRFVTSNNARTLFNASTNVNLVNCDFDFSNNAASANAPIALRADNNVFTMKNCNIYAPNQTNAVIQISNGNINNKLNISGLGIVKPTPATIFTGTLFTRLMNVEAVAP